MDVVWLKRDVRLHDHGPLAEVARSKNPFLVLYLYEPDQLEEPTVHGSHLRFIHEGLIDLDRRLSSSNDGEGTTSNCFQCLTVCHATAISTLETIHEKHHRIGRLLGHQETGHWKSFMRDKEVRKWCRQKKIPVVEFNQTGVTRCLKDRDDYSKKFKEFMAKPRHATPKAEELRNRLVVLSTLPGYMQNFDLDINLFREIPEEHRTDRPQRQQQGGETKALATLNSFLQERGSGFSQGISSPNSSWTSCSRLSPYLSWGHLSLRHVVHILQSRQEQLRNMKEQGRNTGTWLRSLQAFSSRLHWRSHFIQKLESEPELEKRDLCSAYQPLRRQEGDWDENFYEAWATGNTGFPFVDACMRCLAEHGWLNFRMRAMLISFATYNLWLDWKRIAPHMARVFLDYEPGIHYPQLQMQAGTTGINAMRVYSVTKQGKDQDPEGRFVRKFVKELSKVPNQFIHEPWKMPVSVQEECQTIIGASPMDLKSHEWTAYPFPIVDEQESAKTAKAKVAAIRKKDETKAMANKVYQNHGSRNFRRDEMNGKKPKALSTVVEKENPNSQRKLTTLFPRKSSIAGDQNPNSSSSRQESNTGESISSAAIGLCSLFKNHIGSNKRSSQDMAPNGLLSEEEKTKRAPSSWNCNACTYLNEKPFGLVCSMCGTTRQC
jgi:deoxyribodipyrimidine photo-lyase